MKKILLTALFYLFVTNGFSQAFVTTWNTGTDNYIIIPGYGTNYNIAWEEIGNPTHNGSKIATDLDTVFFGNSGSYKVSIGGGSPAFNRISFDTLSLYSYFQRQRLLTVESWGNIVWQTMTYAFSRCTLLTTVPITPPNLSLTTDLSYMFYGCGSFNSDISNWNTGNITNMGSMFCYASSFNQSLNNWNTSNVTNMGNMFGFANSFNQPLNNWNISNVTNMSNMFDNADVFNQPIGNWNTGNVTNMSSMFSISYFNQPLNNWNTNNVTNMESMFNYASSFNQPLNNWNTSNVTNMSNMFNNASVFNLPLNNWNTSKVTNMSYMFSQANLFNQSLNDWDVSNVKDMSYMFSEANLFNQPLNNWNTSSVTNMGGMFRAAFSFNQPLNNWNTSNVTNMSYMFYSLINFNQPLNNWNTSKVINMESMFYFNLKFNQPLNNWNTSNVKGMYGVLSNATTFNQNIGNWDISKVATTYLPTYIFGGIGLDNSGIDVNNYDSILMGWSTQNIHSRVELSATNLHYCKATLNRGSLITRGWLINGDTIASNCILPISFSTFTATPHENKVLLQWQTATETNNAFFTVQKSSNSKDWQNMATVKGSGNSSTIKTYNSIDSKPFNGINYYRIKQTDNNGSYTFSQIKQVTINDKQQTINIYPNPATDVVYINCIGMKEIKIIDQLGQVIQQINNITTEHQTINTKQFAKGVYAVVVETVNGVVTKKMVKE